MTPVERIARSICCHRGGVHHGCAAQSDGSPFSVCQSHTYIGDAQAALSALLEPSMEMLNAAVDATGAGSDMSWSNRSPQTLFKQGFRAMIAQAIAEGRG